MQTHQNIIGAFTLVDFPEYGLAKVVAKIDTGADTGALHATDIKELKSTDDIAKMLSFRPLGGEQVVTSAYSFKKYVRSSNGHVSQRFFIQTQITIDGQTYPIVLTLADRSDMSKPVLIGTRFLRKQGFLVDVSQGAQYRNAVKDKS